MLGKIKYSLKRNLNGKTNYLVLIGVFSIFLLVGGFSFALFTSTVESRGALNIVTGNLYALLESRELDNANSLVLNSGETKLMTVSLKNVNVINAKFNLWYQASDGVSVSFDEENDIPPEKEGTVFSVDEVKTYKLKVTNNTGENQTVTFGSNPGLANKPLSFPTGKKAIEGIIPKAVLDDNMIKVVYDEAKSSWVKADNANWYDYDLGRWANAVTVSSATRSNYMSAPVGSTIAMTDIETMWVWIPRYSYTIGSEDGTNYYGKQGSYLTTAPTQALPGEIDVKFISKEEKDTGTPQYKVSEGVSGWRTPDAFTFGSDELSGIWVGKFETSSSEPSAENGGGNVTTLDSIIKPNVTSWRGIQVANIGEVGRKVSATGNRYGFSSNLDSHAMKNDEWGAVSYLSQSKYGKLGNRDFTGENKEIYQNKSDQFITGCSYGTPSNDSTNYGCQYTYDIKGSGTGASTTGTIYGIYDMSGGAWEYVMANFLTNGQKHAGNNANLGGTSGYSGLILDGTMIEGRDWLEDKYYNFYSLENDQFICDSKPCYSYGLYETRNWYNDTCSELDAEYPFQPKGGRYSHNVNSGIFYTGKAYGSYHSDMTFRLVLIKNK